MATRSDGSTHVCSNRNHLEDRVATWSRLRFQARELRVFVAPQPHSDCAHAYNFGNIYGAAVFGFEEAHLTPLAATGVVPCR